MPELIVSFVISSPHGKPYGYRIYDDGKAEQYRVSKLVKNASGTYEDQQVTPGWYPATTLSAAQIDSLRQAVDSSGLRDLPGQVDSPATRRVDVGAAAWEVMTSGGVRSIHIEHWPLAGEAGSQLAALSAKIGGVVGEALAGNA